MTSRVPGTNLWEVLAGRAPGRPVGPDDPDLWQAVAERLDPARARPELRVGIEFAHLTSVRGQPYVMLRSPDDGEAGYVRLAPEEVELAHLMDGARSVATLVGDFVRISGRLAPDQVTRVVADLAANRMLTELPVHAFRGLGAVRRRHGSRLARRLLDLARGRRVVLAEFDRPAELLYRLGGKLLFTRAFAVAAGLLILAGLGLFAWTWLGGGPQLFVAGGSYATGGLILLGLNIVALAAHELGHALAVKHAGRRVPAIGFLFYFGIPSLFVDTTDVWMAGRRERMLTTAAGPLSALTLAGAIQVAAVAAPELAPIAFKLAFAWYLNALFNLNPLMALDGYYLAMDWLEVPNLRVRGIAFLVGATRRRRFDWSSLDREGRMVAMYGVAAALWTVTFLALSTRMWRDRVGGLVAGLWHAGLVPRLLLAAFVTGLFAPLVHALARWAARRVTRLRERRRERDRVRDAPARLDALRSSALGALPDDLLDGLAADAAWLRPTTGGQVQAAGAPVGALFVVVDGALEGRAPDDPPGSVRRRETAGGLAGLREVLTGSVSPLAWHAAGTRLLQVRRSVAVQALAGVVLPPGAGRDEAEAALDAAPALRPLTDEQREQLLVGMRAVDVEPGRRFALTAPDTSVIVASGVLASPTGEELHAGDLVRPDDGAASFQLVARSQARLWVLPAAALDGLGRGGARSSSQLGEGVHGGDHYPPLVGPPTSDAEDDERADERLLTWFRRILVLLLLFALLAALTAFPPGTGWAEMRAGYALVEVLTALDEPVRVTDPGGRITALAEGGRMAVPSGGGIEVPREGVARLTFAGGGGALVCGGSELRLAAASRMPEGREGVLQRYRPSGTILLVRGRVHAGTASTGASFLPLRLTVHAGDTTIRNVGVARFSADRSGAGVVDGDVLVDGSPQEITAMRRCGGDADAAGTGGDSTTPDPVSTTGGPDPTDPVVGSSPSPSATGPEATPTNGSSAPDATATPGEPDPEPSIAPTEPSPAPSSPAPTPTPSPSPTVVRTFRLACPGAVEVRSRGSAPVDCTLVGDAEYAGSVTLSCDPAPSACSFPENPVPLGPGESVAVTVVIQAAAAPPNSQHDLTVRGTDGSWSASDVIRVVVR